MHPRLVLPAKIRKHTNQHDCRRRPPVSSKTSPSKSHGTAAVGPEVPSGGHGTMRSASSFLDPVRVGETRFRSAGGISPCLDRPTSSRNRETALISVRLRDDNYFGRRGAAMPRGRIAHTLQSPRSRFVTKVDIGTIPATETTEFVVEHGEGQALGRHSAR